MKKGIKILLSILAVVGIAVVAFVGTIAWEMRDDNYWLDM